jgi:hypothetical protein
VEQLLLICICFCCTGAIVLGCYWSLHAAAQDFARGIIDELLRHGEQLGRLNGAVYFLGQSADGVGRFFERMGWMTWTKYVDIPGEKEKAERLGGKVDVGARRDDGRGFVFEIKAGVVKPAHFRAEAKVSQRRSLDGRAACEFPLTELKAAQAWVDATIAADDAEKAALAAHADELDANIAEEIVGKS